MQRITFRAMGGPVEILLDYPPSNQTKVALQAVQQEMSRLEKKYSRYRDDSVIAAIHRQGTKPIALDTETMALLYHAQSCYQTSDGLFDITSGPLSRLWDFRQEGIPSDAQIEQTKQRVGWDKVQLGDQRVTFLVADMELDLGGLVKEMAVDRAVALFLQHGLDSVLINMAGDIAVTGAKQNGQGWPVGIRNPRGERHDALTTLELTKGAIATSGDNERCKIIQGQRYSHIINPITGWPIKGVASVSVMSELCIIAGCASTIAMLKEEKAQDWLEELAQPWILVTDQGIWHSNR